MRTKANYTTPKEAITNVDNRSGITEKWTGSVKLGRIGTTLFIKS